MGGTPELPFGLSTSPGDIPATEVADAVEMALRGRVFPTVPVPNSRTCSLMAQTVVGLDGVELTSEGEVVLSGPTPGVTGGVHSLDSTAFEPLRAMLAAWPDFVLANPDTLALRVDLVGPVTLALALVRAGMRLEGALDVARTDTVNRARSLMAAVRGVEAERVVAVVMDEPRLVGSMHPTFPLSVREVRSLLDPVVDALDTAPGGAPPLIGIHVPGPSDWRTVISSGVSLLSMPSDAGLAGWARWIQALLDNGGFIAWGAVPMDRPLGTSEELLWRSLSAIWCDLVASGVDPTLLRQRCLVSPADGVGRFAADQVDRIRALVDAIGARVRSEAMGSRLGIGA